MEDLRCSRCYFLERTEYKHLSVGINCPEPVSETLCRYFYKRLCLCAIVCLCVIYIGIVAPLACCGL
jgi:hypothetical protein